MRQSVKLTNNWSLLLRGIGVHPDNVLRRANLPASLLTHETATVSIDGYFRLWESVADELPDKPLALLLGQQATAEMFDPAIFAALSSPNMLKAMQRLQLYKRLIGPLKLNLEATDDAVLVVTDSIGVRALPHCMGLTELVFFVSFIRRATRLPISPVRIEVVEMPAFLPAYEEYFGCGLQPGSRYCVAFSNADMHRPFLTANEDMWRFFEPVLQQRLAEIDADASVADRVHAALCELLPSGRGTVQEVAAMLGLSPRSLQRHLQKEDTTFKSVLGKTREQLARHYLGQTQLSVAEIAFLLGFDEPNSFFRAFRIWTGQTPQSLRKAVS